MCSEMSAETERTDGELLAAVASGDGAAFAVFYRRHLPAVVGFLVRETGDREVSADLAADVFAAASPNSVVPAKNAPARNITHNTERRAVLASGTV